MAVSIEELDATVRAFYEARGEQVGNILSETPLPSPPHPASRLLTQNSANLAKSSPSSPQPGKQTSSAFAAHRVAPRIPLFSPFSASSLLPLSLSPFYHTRCHHLSLTQPFLLVPVQGGPRCLAHGRRHSLQGNLPTDEMYVPGRKTFFLVSLPVYFSSNCCGLQK